MRVRLFAPIRLSKSGSGGGAGELLSLAPPFEDFRARVRVFFWLLLLCIH
jgi:hypothetical protein